MILKRLCTFLLMMLVITLTGCLNSGKSTMTPEKATKEQGIKIMESIKNKDAQALKSILCPYIQSHHQNLDNEISGLFEFIDGVIISNDAPKANPSAGTTTAEEGWVERYTTGNIRNIKTSTNRVYSITYSYYLVNKKHPEQLGITDIVISKENETESDYYTIELEPADV